MGALGSITTQLYEMMKALIHKVQSKWQPLGRSPLSPQQPILCTLNHLSSNSMGVSLLGLLRPSNEAQGDVKSSL